VDLKTPELQDLWLEFDVDVIMLVLNRCNTQPAELHVCTIPAVQYITNGGYYLLFLLLVQIKFCSEQESFVRKVNHVNS
jgi:hypothetical protein